VVVLSWFQIYLPTYLPLSTFNLIESQLRVYIGTALAVVSSSGSFFLARLSIQKYLHKP
jgi:hypothetical protein